MVGKMRDWIHFVGNTLLEWEPYRITALEVWLYLCNSKLKGERACIVALGSKMLTFSRYGVCNLWCFGWYFL